MCSLGPWAASRKHEGRENPGGRGSVEAVPRALPAPHCPQAVPCTQVLPVMEKCEPSSCRAVKGCAKSQLLMGTAVPWR